MNSLYGLIGNKLGHSLSKHIHNNIFELLKLDAYYHLFEVKPSDVQNALQGLNILEAVGINVTIPYKCDIMKYLDEVSKEASRIGAVNTIKFKNGKTIGYNTDYFGFKMMLEKNDVDVRNKKIVILGSGGGADSVLQYLIDNNSQELYIASRKIEETKLKYSSKGVIICNYNELKKLKNIDLIINCTPCGMYPNVNESPIDINTYSNYNAAIDLVYNPKETLFLKNASAYGLKTLNGLYMLVAQAITAEEIWNEIKIEEKVIDSIYNSMQSVNYSNK